MRLVNYLLRDPRRALTEASLREDFKGLFHSPNIRRLYKIYINKKKREGH